MSMNDPHERPPDPVRGEALFNRLLRKTRKVADNALDRLRGLSSQLPSGAVEQVERLHENPTHERRKAARLSDSSIPVAVQRAEPTDAADEASVKDHCP